MFFVLLNVFDSKCISKMIRKAFKKGILSREKTITTREVN